MVCLLVLASAFAVPAGADDLNSGSIFTDTYTVVGLAPYLTTSTSFTIEFTGTDQICSVTYVGTTVTTQPWTFTAVPSSYLADVSITDCAGQVSYITLGAIVPFTITSNGYFDAETAVHTISITNQTPDQVGTVKVADAGGKVLGSATVASGASRQVTFRTNQKTPNAVYTLTTSLPGGIQMVFTLTGTIGWTVMSFLSTFYTDCSTLTWIYLPSGLPKGTSQTLVLSDIRGALSRIAAQTGLRFTFSTNLSLRDQSNVITYHWANMGSNGPSGIGGPQWLSTFNGTGMAVNTISGEVTLNSVNSWATSNATAGFGISRTGVAGRGWLLVHESMHAIGFNHTVEPREIMDAVNSGQHSFGGGDLTGLHTLYPKSCRG
jgi:hypothetical protein